MCRPSFKTPDKVNETHNTDEGVESNQTVLGVNINFF